MEVYMVLPPSPPDNAQNAPNPARTDHQRHFLTRLKRTHETRVMMRLSGSTHHQTAVLTHALTEVRTTPCRLCRGSELTKTTRARVYKCFSNNPLPHRISEKRTRKQQRQQYCLSKATRQPESYRWAEELIVQYVKPNSVVGLGTGVLINTVIECMAQMANAGRLQGVKCIPASDVSASEAAFQGVTVTSLTDNPQVDVVFEEVDEIALQDAGLPFVAGRLAEPIQPQLLRMRTLLAASKCNVVLVDGLEKTSTKLQGVLPVVVDADVWEDAGEALDDTFIPDAEIWRRSTVGYDPSDPRAANNPYLSAEGHNILDVKFYGPFKLYGEDAEYGAIAAEVEQQEGIITHGLFVGVASAAALVTADGVAIFEQAVSMQ